MRKEESELFIPPIIDQVGTGESSFNCPIHGPFLLCARAAPWQAPAPQRRPYSNLKKRAEMLSVGLPYSPLTVPRRSVHRYPPLVLSPS